ncbi:electron transport complex subunit RsxG [Marinobacterium sediminicola]|uniref:Ion-translocating oxidoreductase complex subunit G n=1 Tax=Marinobacterium sediminicola TaxID=518898 RepID=A0ABY1RWH6_9GAMM|nr:electron transport complex subunit RsxG [Marinobacterium sediminicola]ULG70306.1 electron transport complex subunit RsxG [Marinobacterium sediminicola]SMR69781.1 electron transport complex protein RnfG [Marinobacterium sediminicola]
MNEILNSIRNNAIAIGLFAIVTSAVIAFTQLATKEKISHNKAEFQARALFEIVPKSLDPDLVEHKLTMKAPELGQDEPIEVYQAIQDGKVVSVLMPVIAPEGYSGDIEMLVGINADSSLAGVRVLSHKETPGLGDKIELSKSDWILSFDDQEMAMSGDDSWAVKKDGGRFDQFTGATITPRAIVGATARAIEFFRAHREYLLTPVTAQAQPTAAGVTQ